MSEKASVQAQYQAVPQDAAQEQHPLGQNVPPPPAYADLPQTYPSAPYPTQPYYPPQSDFSQSQGQPQHQTYPPAPYSIQSQVYYPPQSDPIQSQGQPQPQAYPPAPYSVQPQVYYPPQSDLRQIQGQPQLQLQPQNMTVVVQQAPIGYRAEESAATVSMVGAYVTSCIVLWMCNCLFGLVGFILAVVGSAQLANRKFDSAKKLSSASIIVSIVGVIVTIVIVVIFLA